MIIEGSGLGRCFVDIVSEGMDLAPGQALFSEKLVFCLEGGCGWGVLGVDAGEVEGRGERY